MAHKQATELYTGTGANDNDVLFTTRNVQQHTWFTLLSTTGAVDVFPSVDGTTFATAPLALEDGGATANGTYVLVTAALRIYKFRGPFTRIQVLQNGGTAATAHLLCGPE
jgi:hypothetical protein